MITCVYLSLLKLTRDYPRTCDIRACIASCSPTCESVTYASLTLARFCGTHWHDWNRASAQTSLKLA